MSLKNGLSLLLLFVQTVLCAQYPQYFVYNDENGMPSNEVYSTLQDQRGFIWLGCDAGLFKFDGVRYVGYKSKAQRSKSVAGLTISAVTGKLYCTNFQHQIFCLAQDSLQEIKHDLGNILHLVCDSSGRLLVNHSKGFAVYDETNKQWKNYTGFEFQGNGSTRSTRINTKNKVCFLTSTGVAFFADNQFSFVQDSLLMARFSWHYVMEWWGETEQWLFPFSNQNGIFRNKNGKIEPITRKNLLAALAGKQTNNVKRLADNHLWICTYNGIVRYNPDTDEATVFYPEMAFSDCMIDREGNYWFSTLQAGLLRVPHLDFRTWNTLKNTKLTKMATDGSRVYFASVNAEIGELDTQTETLSLFNTGSKANIQCFDYVPDDNCLYFYTDNRLHTLRNGKIERKEQILVATKCFQKIGNQYFLGSSQGLYLYDLETHQTTEKLSNYWSREIQWDKNANVLWVATNKGLLKLAQTQQQWAIQDTFITEGQVLSVVLDTVEKQLFALNFEGKIFAMAAHDAQPQLVAALPANAQPYRLRQHHTRLYIATNKGLWVYDLKQKKFENIDILSGLASNNVQDVLVIGENIWLNTGKGLQCIPLQMGDKKTRALLHLKNQNTNINLTYGQPLVLFPETSIYSSNGNFEYAYRINGNDWSRLPASIKQIEIQNLSAGNFNIELKAIDHRGFDSENTVLVSGYVRPPFWQTWWFYLLVGASILAVVFWYFRRRINRLQQRQQKEIERLMLENELRLTQQSALKAQMNPHFIFNVLNSIKGYIYENDKKNAALYLNCFADLIRKILEQSATPTITLQEEMEVLKLYIDLEALLLGGTFSYSIDIDENVPKQRIKIPSLLLQPFVENAFKHGLRHKKGDKKLHVHFAWDEPERRLLVSVTDNGIGREAAARINQSKKHNSFASNALAKRIQLLNHEKTETVGLEIIDLQDEQQAATGTKVVLRLHL